MDTCAYSLLCAVHFCGHLRVFAYYVLSTLVDTCAVAGIIIIADKRKIRADIEAKPRFEILFGRVKRK